MQCIDEIVSREPMVVNDLTSSDNDVIDDDDSDIVLDDVVVKKVRKFDWFLKRPGHFSIINIIRCLRVPVFLSLPAWSPIVYPFYLQILEM